MAWSDTYPQLIAALSAKLGAFAPGLPRLTSVDALALFAGHVASLRVGIERACDGVVPSELVDDDGIYSPHGGIFDDARFMNRTITVAGYISHCTPVNGSAWKRHAPDQDDVTSWEPTRVPQGVDFPLGLSVERNVQPEQIYLCREAMDSYQNALAALSIGANLYRDVPWGQPAVDAFLQKVRYLEHDLDNMQANPPTSLTQDVAGALDAARGSSEHALSVVGKDAGKVAAEIGNIAGDVAGSFASGFLGSASLVTIAALVGYVAYKRFL